MKLVRTPQHTQSESLQETSADSSDSHPGAPSPAPDEEFALLTIDDPSAATEARCEPEKPRNGLFSAFPWKIFGLGGKAPEVPEALKLADGERFRMVQAGELLKLAGVAMPAFRHGAAAGCLDSNTLFRLSSKLHAMGLDAFPGERAPFRVKETDLVAVYPREEEKHPPLAYRSVLQTSLYLAAWLIQDADVTPSDLDIVDRWIEGAVAKGRSPVPHMGAVRWLLSRKRILSRRVKTRAASQMARFIHKRTAALALLMQLTANAPQSHLRIKRLEKLFPLFGLAAEDVHSELHRHSTASAPTASRPVHTLDKKKLQEMEQDTRMSQQLLHAVFADEEPELPPPAADDAGSRREELYRKVQERPSWSMEELAALANDYGLSAMAAVEELNETAYHLHDEPLLEEEDDGTFTVNTFD